MYLETVEISQVTGQVAARPWRVICLICKSRVSLLTCKPQIVLHCLARSCRELMSPLMFIIFVILTSRISLSKVSMVPMSLKHVNFFSSHFWWTDKWFLLACYILLRWNPLISYMMHQLNLKVLFKMTLVYITIFTK